MTGVYQTPKTITNEGNNIYRVGGMTIQTISINCPANEITTLSFPEPFKSYVIACFAYNAQVGFSAQQAVSCGAANLSQCMIYQNNPLGAPAAMQIVALGY